LIVREARPGDVAAIAEIYGRSVEEEVASWETAAPGLHEMNRRFGELTSAGFPWLVAEEGAVLGYAYAGPFRARAAYAWSVEDSVYVAEAARGRGIGRALLLALIERCEALGFRQLLAVLGDADGPSRALHAACGFEERGRLPAFGYKHGAWRDLLLMLRPLGEGAATPPGVP
jgi:phosphinothricin acetyltransferase